LSSACLSLKAFFAGDRREQPNRIERIETKTMHVKAYRRMPILLLDRVVVKMVVNNTTAYVKPTALPVDSKQANNRGAKEGKGDHQG
jgi:hypothetical protein